MCVLHKFFLLSCIGFTVIFSLYRMIVIKHWNLWTHTHTFLAQKWKEVKSEKRDSQQICIWFTFHTPRLVFFLLCLECVVVTLHIGNLDHLVFLATSSQHHHQHRHYDEPRDDRLRLKLRFGGLRFYCRLTMTMTMKMATNFAECG